jgi:hypothetical protein
MREQSKDVVSSLQVTGDVGWTNVAYGLGHGGRLGERVTIDAKTRPRGAFVFIQQPCFARHHHYTSAGLRLLARRVSLLSVVMLLRLLTYTHKARLGRLGIHSLS